MWQQFKQNPVAATLAVILHVILITLLVINIDFREEDKSHTRANELDDVKIIEATAISSEKLEQRLQRIEDKKQAEIKRQQEIKKAREEKRLAELEKKRKAEEKRKAELKKAKERELAKKKAEAEKKRQQELEAKRKQEELEKQRKYEAELKAKLEAEQQAWEAEARQDARSREINKYRRLIKQEVTHKWRIPSGARAGMVCEVRVRLLPSGQVASVKIVKSSGNAGYDRSVENAVYAAQPLPVPSLDSGLFDEFREVIFSFDPKYKL